MEHYGGRLGALYGRATLMIPERSQRNARETAYIKAMSRGQVVNAYANWSDFSKAEGLCFQYLPKQARVLDLGCGTGRALKAVGPVCFSYLGVDASPAMIRTARTSHPKMQFAVKDIVNFTHTPSCYMHGWSPIAGLIL